MDAAKRLKLENLIAKGKWNYILIHGVFAWGVGTAILFSFFQYYFSGANFWESIKFSLIVFPISGLAWGAIMWLVLNNQLRKHQQ